MKGCRKLADREDCLIYVRDSPYLYLKTFRIFSPKDVEFWVTEISNKIYHHKRGMVHEGRFPSKEESLKDLNEYLREWQ